MIKIIFSILIVAIMVTTAAAVAGKNDDNLYQTYVCEIELTGNSAVNLINSRIEIFGDSLFEVSAISEEDAKDKFLKKIANNYSIINRKITFILEKVIATGIIVRLDCNLKK